MIKIAIAGNIASGKTAVEGFFKEKGYDILDTDKIGLTRLSKPLRAKIFQQMA